jgi:patatin-like phospholipase/acyl hydrolase
MRALALDGGGFRGIITAVWLEYLDNRLLKPLPQYFEVVAGTSAGSINAALLTTGYSGADIHRMFQELGTKIFPNAFVRTLEKIGRIPKHGFSSPRYGEKRINRVLQETFGDATMRNAETRLLIPVYSMTEARAMVIDSEAPEHADLPLWKVVRASSAAPTFFPATTLTIEGKEHVVVDGGVAINHPAMTASTALRKQHGVPLSAFEIVSMGTGRPPTIGDLKSLQGAGLIDWGPKLVHFLLGAPSDHVNYLCRKIHGDKYHRIEVDLPYENYAIDDASPQNTAELVQFARSVFNQLDPIVELLGPL